MSGLPDARPHVLLLNGLALDLPLIEIHKKNKEQGVTLEGVVWGQLPEYLWGCLLK